MEDGPKEIYFSETGEEIFLSEQRTFLFILHGSSKRICSLETPNFDR